MFSKLAMILCGVLLMAGIARAEHKLLITDMLDKGQIDAEADIGYCYSSNTFTVKYPAFQKGKVIHRITSTDLSLDFGVGHDLQFGISLPYILSDRYSYGYSSPPAPSHSRRSEGWGDFALGVKYRLLGGNDMYFTLVTGLDIKLDTANEKKEGSGTTDNSPYLAVSTTAAEGKLRPYAYYRAIFRNHKVNDSHILGVGAEYAPYKSISLVPFANVQFRTDSATIEGYESYMFGISSFIQIVRNFYLIPTGSYSFGSSTRTTDKTQDLSGLDGYNVSLGLYYLFN